MGFQKGNKGRPVGAKNKDMTLVEQTAKRLGVDIFEILCLFAQGDWKSLGYENECYFMEKPDGGVKMGYVISPDSRLHAAKEACKYLYSQKRAVELSTAPEGITVNVVRYVSKK